MPPDVTRRPAAGITSRSNGRVKQLRAAFAHDRQSASGLVAIEGDHLLEEALRSGVEIHSVFLSQDRPRPAALPPETDLFRLPPEIFASAVATRSPRGVAALVRPGSWSFAALPELPCPLLLIAARLQDPGNLGTLVRSAESFGADAVLTTQGTVDPWNGKALRASAGSLFRTPVVPCDLSELQLLQSRGIRLLAAVAPDADEDRGGIADVSQIDLTRPVAFLVGNEGAGLDPEYLELADIRVTIPFSGPAESLNAAVAGSVLLYEASRQRRAKR